MHLFVSSNVSAVIAINFVRLPDLSKRFLVTCKVIHFLTVIKQIFYYSIISDFRFERETGLVSSRFALFDCLRDARLRRELGRIKPPPPSKKISHSAIQHYN